MTTFDPALNPNPAIKPVQEENSDLDVKSTLQERGSRYGKFTDHAALTQELKECMTARTAYSKLAPDQKEALEMIQHKIGRIINGDPNYLDSWVDIAGYATLVAKRLEGKEI